MKTLALLNSSFSISLCFSNHFINSSLDLFKGSFHNGLSFRNLSINSILQFLKEINNGRDEVLNGMFQSWLENIIKEIIKDTISNQLVLQLCQLSHDFFQKLNKKSFTLFNSSLSIGLGFGNHFINSRLNLFKGSLDNRCGSSNLSFNNSFQFLQEVLGIGSNFTRDDLLFQLIKDLFNMLGNIHDISDGHIFSGLPH